MARIRGHESNLAITGSVMKWAHGGIEVSDLSRSIQFYERYFGFRLEEKVNINGEELVFLRNGEVCLELIQSSEKRSSTDLIHFAFKMNDLASFMHDLFKKGQWPIEPPVKCENGVYSIFFEGPDQELIELIGNLENEEADKG
jgi:lactoylglutathione lyase